MRVSCLRMWWSGLAQLLVCVCVCVVAEEQQQDSPVVQTAQGKLRGKFLNTYTGKKIISFIGVRYAEPPIGQNRFKPPVPLKAWDGIVDAVEDGPLCTQTTGENITYSEDCLYLNVYSKNLTGKQPVIIYLHEGGFLGGSGSSVWRGPQYFLDQDIVLVTLNYRFGALGFLSTGDSVLPGNYGLRDQLEVLKWVQRNIAVFGGDPDSVTLYGYSAGASSLQFHMLSPLSKGLFHRGIAGSCSATTPAVLNRDPASLSRRFANILNCSTESSQHIRDCLLKVPEKDILEAQSKIWDTLQVPFTLFAPVIDKYEGEESFLRDDPVKIIQSGQFSHVPLITGFTKDEFNWRAQYLLTNETYVQRINKDFDEIAPWEFQYPREPKDVSKQISDALKQFYLHDQPVSNSSEKGLGELYADSLIIFSVYQAAKLLAEVSTAPVYFYLFNFEGRYSFQYKIGTQTPYGVGHHDDLIYLYYISPWFPLFNETDPEAHMVRTLTTIYSNFAKTGIPTLPSNRSQWAPMTPDRLQYLEISSSLSMREGLPYPQRMWVWESQLPLELPYRQIVY